MLLDSNIFLYEQSDSGLIFKLGDFGSAMSGHSIDFTKASKKEIGKFFGKIEKTCTKIYRAPEMID